MTLARTLWAAWILILVIPWIEILSTPVGAQGQDAAAAVRALSDADKDEVRKVVIKELEFHKGRLEDTQKNLEKWLEFCKYMGGLLLAAAAFTGGLQLYNAKNAKEDVEKIRDEARRIRDEAKEQMKLLEDKGKTSADEMLKSTKARFNRLVEFHQMQFVLAARIPRLGEPSMRLSITKDEVEIIRRYLDKLTALTEGIGNADVLSPTPFDCEMTGDAYHYLATAEPGDDASKLKNENEAIDKFRLTLRQYSEHRDDPRARNTKRKLANALMGAADAAGSSEVGIPWRKEAIGIYEGLASHDTDDARALLSWGDALKSMEKFEEAANKYGEAGKKEEDAERKTSRDWGEAHYQQANMLTALGGYDKAITCYKTIIDTLAAPPRSDRLLDPRFETFEPDWVHLSLGDAFRKRNKEPGDLEEARGHYKTQMGMKPSSESEVHFRIGQTWLAIDDYVQARTSFRKAEDKGCQMPLFWAYYGYVLLRSPDKDKARKLLEEAREKQAYICEQIETCQANYNLAVCHAMAGDIDQVLSQLEIAIRMNPIAKTWAHECNDLDFIGITGKDDGRQRFEKIVGARRPGQQPPLAET